MPKTSPENLRQTMQERVYEHLMDRIKDGSYKPGEQLGEAKLKEELGIGHIPLREALGRLERDGVIEYRSYRGYRVRSFSPKELAEIYDVREALECFAVAQLPDDVIPGLLDELAAWVEEIAKTDIPVESRERDEADLGFHAAIIRATDNSCLQKIFEQNQLHIMLAAHASLKLDWSLGSTQTSEHADIYDALKSHDRARASKIIARHIRDSKAYALARIEKALREN